MRHLLNLKTPVLALFMAIAAEALFFGVSLLASVTSPRDNPVLAWRLFGRFHSLPERLTMSFMAQVKPFHDIQSIQAKVAVTLMIILLALLQWYVVCFVCIGLFRRFRRKSS